ncbi:MAG: hypothetical protein FWC29_02095, partial [Methanomassiliicoccaceae archaeon]|nr:hypothetical protein [Methanomassiliicoccaceae archaeon]
MPFEMPHSTVYSEARSHMERASPGYDMNKAAEMLERLSAEGISDAQYLYSLFLLTGTSAVRDD